jgi:linearmycin/streptolysin S transport system permease protein
MGTAWLICRKDLKARLRDRSALLVGIIVPLGLAFIFNAVFSGAAGGNAVVKLGVADQDGGQEAQVFVHDVLGGAAKGGFIAVRAEPDEATVRSLVGSSKLNAAFVIPRGFSAAVESNQAASLEVIGNPDKPISAEIARSIAEGYASDLNRVRLSLAVVMTGPNGAISRTSIPDLATAASRAGAPVAVLDVTTKTKELNAKSFYAAGMAVFFVFFVVQFGAAGLLEERANGTLARLVAAPISRSAILVAKMLTSLILGVISMGVLVVATTWLFGASWGNPLGVGVLIVAAVLAALAVMALVATVAKTSEQAGQWQSVVAVVLGLLGGTFFPVSHAPGVLSNLTFLAPQAWFLRGLGDLRGGSLAVVWTPALAMVAFAVVFGGLAMSRLPRMAEV